MFVLLQMVCSVLEPPLLIPQMPLRCLWKIGMLYVVSYPVSYPGNASLIPRYAIVSYPGA